MPGCPMPGCAASNRATRGHVVQVDKTLLHHLVPRYARAALRYRGPGQGYLHRVSTLRLQRFVRTSLWLLPIGCLAAGTLLALGTLAVDRATGYQLLPQSLTGTPSDAQTILSSFATAMVSLTTLVLTVTLVAVQLAMGQFSPRIVGALLTDRWSQLAIGLFGASFLVAVLTLREIRGSDTGTVPGLSMLLSYVLMLASIVVLVLFVHHAGQGLRVSGLIDLVGDRSREFIVRQHGDLPAVPGSPDEIVAAQPGNLIRGDRPALVAAARRAPAPPRPAGRTACWRWSPSSGTSSSAARHCSGCIRAPGRR